MKRRHLAAFVAVPMALLLLSSQPLVAASPSKAHALGSRQATTSPATATVGFGAKLTVHTQPQNAGPAHVCAPLSPDPSPCTWVMNKSFNRTNGEAAPKDGVIAKIRVIAAVSGQFRLQLVKEKSATSRAKALRNGPTLHYNGQPDNAVNYVIETFKVNVTVHKGERLAAKGNALSILSCSGGGANVLQFEPPLVVGSGLRTADDHDGCFLLIEAQYK
jgi:hypothetical protein